MATKTKTLPMNHAGGVYIKKTKKVEPSAKVCLWLNLRSKNYITETAMGELIDNVINNTQNRKHSITFEWNISRKFSKKSTLSIVDTAEGIHSDLLDEVWELGKENPYYNPNKKFSEHGEGMKAAILSLGELDIFKTKSDKQSFGMELIKCNISEKHRAEKPILTFDSFQDSKFMGTTIGIKTLNYGLVPCDKRELKVLNMKLGATYSSFIEKNKLEIKMVFNNLDTGKTEYDEVVTPHKRIYAHGNKEVSPGIPVEAPQLPMKKLIVGKGKDRAVAYFQAGYKPDFEQLALMTGVDDFYPKGSPFRVTQDNVGFDVYKNGRKIISGLMGDAKSGRGTRLQGEIHLQSGFTTTTTKNDIVQDDNWAQLKEKILAQVKAKRLDDRVLAGFKHIHANETQLNERVVNYLRKQTIFHSAWGVDNATEQIQGHVDLFNSENKPIGQCDVLISPDNSDWVMYELKRELIDTQAVRQLFGYMKSQNINSGMLGAQKISPMAQNLVDDYNDNHDVDIKFWDFTNVSEIVNI